jgi:cell wall-associated NlpC family hydrolase
MITTTPDRVIAEANKFINAPFCHRGRSILGLDCLGLIIVSFKKCGIIIPSDDGMAYHPRWWNGNEERLHNHLLKCDFEIVESPCKGDIVTFRIFGAALPACHCGFYLSEDYVLHTRGSGPAIGRRTKAEMIGPAFKRRIGLYFRYKGYI